MVGEGYSLAPLFEAYYDKWQGSRRPGTLRLRPDWFEFLDNEFRVRMALENGVKVPPRANDPRFLSCRVERAPDLLLPWEFL